MERNWFLFQITNIPEDIMGITSCLCVMGSESSNGISAFLRRTQHFGVLISARDGDSRVLHAADSPGGKGLGDKQGVGEGLVGFSNLMIAQRCQNFTAVHLH